MEIFVVEISECLGMLCESQYAGERYAFSSPEKARSFLQRIFREEVLFEDYEQVTDETREEYEEYIEDILESDECITYTIKNVDSEISF